MSASGRSSVLTKRGCAGGCSAQAPSERDVPWAMRSKRSADATPAGHLLPASNPTTFNRAARKFSSEDTHGLASWKCSFKNLAKYACPPSRGTRCSTALYWQVSMLKPRVERGQVFTMDVRRLQTRKNAGGCSSGATSRQLSLEMLRARLPRSIQPLSFAR